MYILTRKALWIGWSEFHRSMLMHDRRSLGVGEVRYLSITDESRPVGPPGLPDLSAGPELWPFLSFFGASTAQTSSASAWPQSSVCLPWCRPDLWSSAPGEWQPAPTPFPAFWPPAGAAYRADPALRAGFCCFRLGKRQPSRQGILEFHA